MTTTVYIDPTRAIFGGGTFDSNNRYIRAAASGAVFPMPLGETLDFNSVGTYPEWRYSVSGYSIQSNSPSDPTFTASVVSVKI